MPSDAIPVERIGAPVRLPLAAIRVPQRRYRALQPAVVEEIVSSFSRLGQRVPVTVQPADARGGEPIVAYELIVGHHRLEAARELGWTEIDAWVRDCNETEARLWEISENLHRAELSVLDRSDCVAEWRRLKKEKGGQVDHPSVGGTQPHDKAISATARELGVGRKEVARAAKIASLTPEAKEAARETDAANNQSALLAAAKETSPEAQVESLQRQAAIRRFRREARLEKLSQEIEILRRPEVANAAHAAF